jgi:hypothetical protein
MEGTGSSGSLPVRSDGAPLLAGCRELYHDLIAPGRLAIRSCDPYISIHPDQPSRLVGVRGDFQRKGSACSNISSIVQERPNTASWSRLRSAPRKAVNFKNWNDASLRWRITSRSSRTITRVPCTLRTMTNPAARSWSRKSFAVSWGGAHHAMEHLTDDAATGGLRHRRVRGQVAGDSGAAGTDRPVSAQAQG